MLMMHDPEVHFHILPRYAIDQNFEGRIFKDIGWPGMPNLKSSDIPDGPPQNEVDKQTFQKLVGTIKSAI